LGGGIRGRDRRLVAGKFEAGVGGKNIQVRKYERGDAALLHEKRKLVSLKHRRFSRDVYRRRHIFPGFQACNAIPTNFVTKIKMQILLS
jgi:hypothetical protein